ncbi:MAG: putative membrane protein [Hyphomicrobiaceae bacterium]|jgi:uncharacterized membrane protein
MEAMNALNHFLRWIHVIAGIMWIGLLFFFNFVNGPFAATMDGPTKKAVVPELMPRALYWFRMGAAWTWITGVLLLFMVFYHGGIMFDDSSRIWGMGTFISLGFVFGGVFIYDFLMMSTLFGDQKIKNSVGFVVVALLLIIMDSVGFSARSYMIHIGTLFGTIMAYNVWFRIWPAQQQIITAIKNGEAPAADLPALAGLRSKHNTYLSVPLVWTMLNQHTASVTLGAPQYVVLLVVILLGWHIVWQFYRKAGTIKGF